MGKVIALAAPSGSGKTTIARHLLATFSDLKFSISATTRSPRGNEIHGKDYYFLTPDEFKQRIANDEFVEWEEVYENKFYGTLKSEVERIWSEGNHVVFDVDVRGGVTLKQIYGEDALTIFVNPPSYEVLEERLRSRNTDSEDMLLERLTKAKKELEYSKYYDTILINDKIDVTLLKAEVLIKSFNGAHQSVNL